MESVILDTLVTGLPVVITYAGIYLVFRIMNDFDLTVDGTFTTGGAVSTVLLLHGVPAGVCIVLAALAGGAMGLVTTALHVWLRIPILLAGLLMSLALFSINLRIMGQPDLSLLSTSGIFGAFANFSSTAMDLATAGLLLGIDVIVLAAVGLFLRTEAGLALRATGLNPTMARAQGVHQTRTIALALVLANALAAAGGALTVQEQGFVDVNGGTGTLIAGVGALLLGELLLRPTPSRITRAMAAVLTGAVAYQLVQVIALRLGLDTSDLKLVTAMTLIVAVTAQLAGHRFATSVPGSTLLRRLRPPRPGGVPRPGGRGTGGSDPAGQELVRSTTTS